jgi:hypothetical protein
MSVACSSVLRDDVHCLGDIILDGRRVGKLTKDADLTIRESRSICVSKRRLQKVPDLLHFHGRRQALDVQTERHLVGTSGYPLCRSDPISNMHRNLNEALERPSDLAHLQSRIQLLPLQRSSSSLWSLGLQNKIQVKAKDGAS